MSTIDRIVIIGAGLAGARAAEAIRKAGYDGALVLLGEEPERPYIRPPLSKDYLRGEADRATVHVHPETFYAEQDIDLRASTPVLAIDPAARTVVLDGTEAIAFDRLLLATGAVRGPCPSRCGAAGVLALRTWPSPMPARRAADASASSGRRRWKRTSRRLAPARAGRCPASPGRDAAERSWAEVGGV